MKPLHLLLLCLTAHAELPVVPQTIHADSHFITPAYDPYERWNEGLRGYPTQLSVVSVPEGHAVLWKTAGDDGTKDAYPSADDVVTTFTRPLSRAINPVLIYWLWLPPFEQWEIVPEADRYLFGVRCTIRDYYAPGGFDRLQWPGLFMALRPSDGAPYFYTRTLYNHAAAPIPQAGWWTLGFAWSAAGKTKWYAKAGRHETITEADFIDIDDHYPDVAPGWPFPEEDKIQMEEVQGLFITFRTRRNDGSDQTLDWKLGRCIVYSKMEPHTLSIAREGDNSLLRITGQAGVEYSLYHHTKIDGLRDHMLDVLHLPAAGYMDYTHSATDRGFYTIEATP